MKAKFFLINFLRIAIYWAVFYVAMIPFFEFTWKTLAAGFVLGFFAGMLNQLITTIMVSGMQGITPKVDVKQLDDLMSQFFGQGDVGQK